MNTENTMMQTPAATITEKELFGRFIRMQIKHRNSFGVITRDYMSKAENTPKLSLQPRIRVVPPGSASNRGTLVIWMRYSSRGRLAPPP